MSSDIVEAAGTRAKEKEKSNNWLEAAKFYEQALASRSKDISFAAETWENIGFCYLRASTQAEDTEEFKKIRQQAVEAYRNAAKLFEKEDNLQNQGKSAQCYASAEYASSWLASDSLEKKRINHQCCLLGRKSLEAYEKVGDQFNYGKMCNDLLQCLIESLHVASDWREMKNIVQEGIDCGDKAIEIWSKLENKSELLRAYATASLQSWHAYIGEEEEKRKELVGRSLSYSEKALELSREVDNTYYAAMSNWAAALATLIFTDKTEKAREYAQEMLKQAAILRDNYLIGVASYILAFVTNWILLKEEDPDKKKEGYEKIVKHSQEAIHRLRASSHDFYIAETYLFYAESYSSLARDFEVSSGKKRATSENAVQIGRKGLEHAIRSGSPDATGSTLHALSKALHFLSSLKTEREEKTRLLEEALNHRKEYIKIVEKAFPFNDWIRGVGKNYEGLIKAELSRVETDRDKKTDLLKSAASDMEEGTSQCRKWILSRHVPTLISAVGRFEDWLGGILNELYILTEDKEMLARAIEVYGDAAKKFKEINLSSRVAECYWKTARNHDRLGSYHKAAEIFENAFAEYKTASQKILLFADFYLDYATYMKAWHEIEQGKLAHKNEEYSVAAKHYENTANLLKSSKLWGYLAPNFLALSFLEQAEDLSRKEKSIESTDAFKRAAELFNEAQEAFENEITKITVSDERENAIELEKACLRRKDYCLARADVEQARMDDLKGDYAKSAEKYDSAATTFEKILKTLKDETVERKEIESIIHMCRAWQKMKIADGRDLPEFYHEASELFMKAREHSANDRTSLLALGNNALCKALEFGTRFEESRVKESLSKAKQFLGSASKYYLKAGFENASLWTSATETVFDAYSYISDAEAETDPRKKMNAYLVAEKCLEQSAGLYEKAGYIGKRDEVLRALKKIKEKREFALSLGELLAAPADASSTTMISTPRFSVEEPVGFSKFDGAFVQANVVASSKEILFGESFPIEVHIANLGKDAAFLVKIENIIPEGCDLIDKPQKGVIEDGFLNLKGKKLGPLEAEDMKLRIKPRKKGEFIFTPKIRYMNEAGEYRHCELEQVTIRVKQLGIRGWLQGPS
ncbi:MAG TPA: hypothetical protein VJ249_08735 [Candidatus Bathyarchaeia archaeon]|nr:hypothetical protein [Candidatus Bathyarchaeia archaeon]